MFISWCNMYSHRYDIAYRLQSWIFFTACFLICTSSIAFLFFCEIVTLMQYSFHTFYIHLWHLHWLKYQGFISNLFVDKKASVCYVIRRIVNVNTLLSKCFTTLLFWNPPFILFLCTGTCIQCIMGTIPKFCIKDWVIGFLSSQRKKRSCLRMPWTLLAWTIIPPGSLLIQLVLKKVTIIKHKRWREPV